MTFEGEVHTSDFIVGSITLEGRFMDSQYGSLTLRSEIAKAGTVFGDGEIGLRWNSDGNGLSIVYKGPPNPYSEPDPYRVLDVATASEPIGDGTFDSMSGSTGTATIRGKVVIMDSISMGESAVAKLDGKDASVSHGGITISIREPANDAEIRGGEAGFTVANAVVRVNEEAPAELTLTAGLKNVLLDNSRSDTKLIAQVGADSLSGIQADAGKINLVQLAEDASLLLETLLITNGGSVSVSPTTSASNTICIGENGMALFGVGSELNADLTLGGGSHVRFDDVLTMNGQFSLGTGIILTSKLLASMESMVPGDELILIQGTGPGLSYAENLDGNAANMFFNNIDAAFRIMADENGFGLVMASAAPAPEPGTCVFSLVALSALAARRRRR